MIVNGTIRYSERPKEGDNESWWIVVDVNAKELCSYYRHLFHLASYRTKKLSRPMWGEHITVNYGEEPADKSAWMKYSGKTIELNVSITALTENAVFWFPVNCITGFLSQIRVELGLSSQPWNPFHLCLGYCDEDRQPKSR